MREYIKRNLRPIVISITSLYMGMVREALPISLLLGIINEDFAQANQEFLTRVDNIVIPFLVLLVFELVARLVSEQLVLDYTFVNCDTRHNNKTFVPKEYQLGVDVLSFNLDIHVKCRRLIRMKLFRKLLKVKFAVCQEEWMDITHHPRRHAKYNLARDDDRYCFCLEGLIGDASERKYTYEMKIHIFDDTSKLGQLRLEPVIKYPWILTIFGIRLVGQAHELEFYQ